MTVFALLGAKALYLTYLWLLSAIAGAYLSGRKGFGERPGLACGLLLNIIGPIIWLLIPAKDGSMWKVVGPFGSTPKEEKERMEREAAAAGGDKPGTSD